MLSLTLYLSLAAACAANIEMPFWPQYPTRTSQLLNGEWQFGYKDGIEHVINYPLDQVETPDTATVPGCFDVSAPGILGRRGTAFYAREFDLAANTPGLLYFAACSFYCLVHVDGVVIADHRSGGYQPFTAVVPPSSSSTRKLVVYVDNRFNATTAPTHTGGDFWNYGGITRDVILHEQPADTYLERVETFTTSLEGNIDVNIVLGGNTSVDSIMASFSFDVVGPTTPSFLPVVEGVASTSLRVPSGKVWSMHEPNLHTLTVMLNGGADGITVRFGLRILGVQGNRLTINNETVKLHGYNRHTMWADTGSALTLDQVKQDVAILLDVGANYVRGAHYPQDQRFLDLCDENGIVVWEETLGPGVQVPFLQDPYFMKQQIQAVNEMVSASINHPSVIFHGFYNEGPSDQKDAIPGYNASASAIRARVGSPPSRLVTWASNKLDKDVCLHIADVISFNDYPGWYNKPGDVNYTKVFWQEKADWVESNFPTKPWTISETGASGIYEWSNSTDPLWSPDYQREILTEEVIFALGSDRLSGITLWQFADTKANDDRTALCGQCVYAPHPDNLTVPWDCAYISDSCKRPGGENHKGSIDFWRRTKPAYDSVKQLFSSSP